MTDPSNSHKRKIEEEVSLSARICDEDDEQKECNDDRHVKSKVRCKTVVERTEEQFNELASLKSAKIDALDVNDKDDENIEYLVSLNSKESTILTEPLHVEAGYASDVDRINYTSKEKNVSALKPPVVPCEAPKPKVSSAYANLKWMVVRNDGKPESMLKLVGLKSLFAKQLPKMPRPYISRLVFDKRHTSLAILSDNPSVIDSDEEIIGGICYRAFEDMRFAEIAFCAVNASHQVKGYGTKLMNLLKKHAAEQGIEFFITYADNYAIGYFKKQGFTKSITMPKGRYFGLIKDYDGGTPMECYVHPSIDFTRIPEMLAAQKQFLLSRIEMFASSRTVYPPLPQDYNPNLAGVSRANLVSAKAMTIPGVIEAGWTLNDIAGGSTSGGSSSGGGSSGGSSGVGGNGIGGGTGGTLSTMKDMDRSRNALRNELLGILRKIEEQQFAWPFREPVDPNEVPDYLDVIQEPIDLSTIEKRIRSADNHYKSKQMLFSDLMLMVNNCKLYNDDASSYMACAISLEKFLQTIFDMK